MRPLVEKIVASYTLLWVLAALVLVLLNICVVIPSPCRAMNHWSFWFNGGRPY